MIDAVRFGKSALAIRLLKGGCDVDVADSKGRSALWWACALGRSNVIPELVKRGATLPDDALIGPAERADERIVRLLLRHGANVNCMGSTYSAAGWHHHKQVLLTVALGGAATHGKEAVPILLIRAGAAVNRLISVERLPQGLHNRSMLGLAAHYGLLRTVRAMIRAGADVNLRDNRGRTALIDAIEQGHADVAKALKTAGAR